MGGSKRRIEIHTSRPPKHVAIVARRSCRAGVSDELGASFSHSLPFAWSLTAGRGEDVFDRVSKVVVHGLCVCLLPSQDITCCET
jgi:hypothetical protein